MEGGKSFMAGRIWRVHRIPYRLDGHRPGHHRHSGGHPPGPAPGGEQHPGQSDQPHGLRLLNLLRDERGSSFLELLLVIPILVFFTFAPVEYWAVLTQHQYAEHLMHRTLSRMQIDGLLTTAAEAQLRTDIDQIGGKNIVITGTLASLGAQPVLRPGDVQLQIQFEPKFRPLIIGRIIGANEPGVVIRVGGRAPSERVY